MSVEYILAVDNPRRSRSYVWGDRFTSDEGTATRFPSPGATWKVYDNVARHLHLEDRLTLEILREGR